MNTKFAIPCAIVIASAGLLGSPAAAAPPSTISGAIFTSDVSGVPVNLNIYEAKEDVYLNGGPGINAPDGAAGLPDGTYSFQVTDPSGKVLLSTDAVVCRQFTVVGGVIEDVVDVGGCEHATGADGEDGGATVQLFPYNNTQQRRRLQGLGQPHKPPGLLGTGQQAVLRSPLQQGGQLQGPQ